MESPWGSVCFTVPFVVLSSRGNLVIIEQLMLLEVLGIDVTEQLRDSIRRLTGKVRGKKPLALDVPRSGIEHQVYLATEALRGVGGGLEGNGYMDDVVDGLVSKYSQVFMEVIDETEVRRNALGKTT